MTEGNRNMLEKVAERKTEVPVRKAPPSRIRRMMHRAPQGSTNANHESSLEISQSDEFRSTIVEEVVAEVLADEDATLMTERLKMQRVAQLAIDRFKEEQSQVWKEAGGE